MAAKYVVKKGSTGKFRFSLHATNGQIIATSEAYETKRAALAGIASIRKNADAPVDDQTTATAAAAAPAKKATAKRSPAKKTAAKRTPAKKTAAKRT